MAIFRPPTDDLLTYINRLEQDGIEYELFKFYSPEPRGRNVFKLSDNSYVETEPADFSTIVKVYHGGHDHVLEGTEEADLIAAGYGAYIS